MELCPHCGATSTTEPSRALRWVCGVCGGARVPGMKLGRKTVATLALAKHDRTKQLSATVVAGALGVMAILVASLALISAATAHGVPALVTAAIAAADFTAAMTAWAFAKRRGATSRDALDTAWATAAAHVARKRGGQITARELAAEIKISETDADAILAKLSAGGASVEVDDDAELHYRVDAGVESAVDSTVAPQSETASESRSATAEREARR